MPEYEQEPLETQSTYQPSENKEKQGVAGNKISQTNLRSRWKRKGNGAQAGEGAALSRPGKIDVVVEKKEETCEEVGECREEKACEEVGEVACTGCECEERMEEVKVADEGVEKEAESIETEAVAMKEEGKTERRFEREGRSGVREGEQRRERGERGERRERGERSERNDRERERGQRREGEEQRPREERHRHGKVERGLWEEIVRFFKKLFGMESGRKERGERREHQHGRRYSSGGSRDGRRQGQGGNRENRGRDNGGRREGSRGGSSRSFNGNRKPRQE